MSVPFQEIDDSPHFNIGPRGEMGATRKFVILWSNVEAFIVELLFGGTFGLPAQFPTFPALRVSGIDIVPFIETPQGGTLTNHQTQNSLHDDALVTVTYAPGENNTTDQDVPSDTWAEYDIQFAGELVEIQGQDLKYEADDERLPADVHPTVHVPQIDHVITWHRVYAPPWEHIANLEGKVNANEWKVPATGMWMAAQTLLFVPGGAKRSYDSKNARDTWSLEYRFRQKAAKGIGSAGRGGIKPTPGSGETVYGWNHVLRKDGTWDRPLNATTNEPLYQSGDFSDLFQFQASFL